MSKVTVNKCDFCHKMQEEELPFVVEGFPNDGFVSNKFKVEHRAPYSYRDENGVCSEKCVVDAWNAWIVARIKYEEEEDKKAAEVKAVKEADNDCF